MEMLADLGFALVTEPPVNLLTSFPQEAAGDVGDHPLSISAMFPCVTS